MDAKKNLNENNLFAINDDSEKNVSPKKLKKHTISQSSDTEGETTGSTTDTNKPDLRVSAIVNGSDDQVVDNSTEASNINLNIQLKSSLKMITNIKQSISEFENVLMNTLPEKLFLENHEVETYSNLKRKDNSFTEFDEKKKRRLSRDHHDSSSKDKIEIEKLKELLVQNKKKMNTLEKELNKKNNVKKTITNVSESDAEYEDESDSSVYQGKTQKSSPSKHSKKLKNVKKSRGRPRKSISMYEEKSNSISEPKEKKLRGRPRKSEISHVSSASKPTVKGLRGRPRKHFLVDQSSTSINDGKLESERSELEESTSSIVAGANISRGSPKKRSTTITKIENSSNETPDNGENKARRSRGRPKSTNTLKKVIGQNVNTPSKGRGRPKKNKPVSDLTSLS